MNFTLISLTLLHGTICFTDVSRSFSSKNSFSRISLSNFFSPFLISNNLKSSNQISNSKFKQFIHSPIKMSSLNIEKFTTRISTNDPQYKDESSLTISDSTFLKCQSGNAEPGGAISISSTSCILIVLDSFFSECSSPQEDGGAIYFCGKSSTYTRCCFSRCYCKNHGGVIDNALSLQSASSYISLSTMFNNINVKENEGFSILSFFNGNQNIKQINLTSNSISNQQFSSSLYFKDFKNLFFEYSTLQNLTSAHFNHHTKGLNAIWQQCNFIGNKNSDMFIVVENVSMLTMISIKFINNNKLNINVKTNNTVLFIECDCDTPFYNEKGEIIKQDKQKIVPISLIHLSNNECQANDIEFSLKASLIVSSEALFELILVFIFYALIIICFHFC